MDIGIDLGTANTLLYVRGKGIVLNEPSVVAVRDGGRGAPAIGDEARESLGRTPDSVSALRPMREGVIGDYEAAREMIRYFVRKALKGRRTRTRMVVCMPTGVTPVELRAIVQAAQEAGGRTVHLLDESMAAAMGAGLPVDEPRGSMVVDIGGGTTEVAVISMGGIVTSRSLRLAGDRMNTAITEHIREERSLLIGERTAEEVKLEIGSAWPVPDDQALESRTCTVRGREKINGVPTALILTAAEIREAMHEPIEAIVATVQSTLAECPPELAADVMKHGIVLTGGGSLLPGLDQRIASATGIAVTVAGTPLECVALGTGKCVEEFDSVSTKVLTPAT
ncbi:rod shape-determining protein [Streptomyces sp. NBC_01020]|uniref:rod shape-determining protein n=1 Tax=unclassified Streptomyces TaxID=2593676 RepID=UPI00225A84CA|nr:rod shape-determining protein [Streptomyces sp. NBC_01306]MCX4726582.1 rod shape-determining protein [Streptomyces sp. NBC_01306]WSV04102.1 rod shape-determining protein [Streptomyces sp. NBC_01020]WSX42165.1 rod shape-determining protein [Streptomyces sp. NBC_00963]